MGLPLNIAPCLACGAAPLLRTVLADELYSATTCSTSSPCEGSGAAFVNGFDFYDETTVIPWTLAGGVSYNSILTGCSPTTVSPGGNPQLFFSGSYCVASTPTTKNNQYFRSQILMPLGSTQYFVLEVNATTLTVNQGCIGTNAACGIVDLPFPGVSGGQILYIFGFYTTGSAFYGNPLPNYTGSLLAFANNFDITPSPVQIKASMCTISGSFSSTQTCYPSPYDPFTGAGPYP